MPSSQRFARAFTALAAVALCAAGIAGSGVGTPGGSRLAPLRPGGDPGAGTGGLTAATGGPARPVVVAAGRHDGSAPLRSITPRPPQQGKQDPDAEGPQPLPGRSGATAPAGGRDPALQTAVAQAAPPSVSLNFEGVSNVNGVLPPDTNGDIGPNDYVQWVNLSFAIYDRSGTKLYGPAAGNTLWTGFGGPCETSNDGDPIAQYDHLADRWVMTQFALPNYPSGPFYQCFAVSKTGDPLGAYWRYEFEISATKLNDYPHLGVWPDAYYLSINQFSGNSWGGQGAVAFDRSAMLAGQTASMVYFDLFSVDQNLGGMLPSDLDGPAPPSGAPNVFVEADDNAAGFPQDQLQLWSFHVDWTTPASSTFTHTGNLATAAFDSNLCNFSRNCIPQPGNPPRGLDALSDRIMYRLQYRNFGDHQALIVNHTVDVDGADRAGIRWYELRKTSSTWSIYQQGTYSPDSTDRWLASAAMDGDGNIAMGYSVSSGSVYPSIRYTGRLAGDTLGTMSLGEGTIISGTGRQTSTAYRWGDYAMLAVDPTDDCTFWFTSEYYQTTGNAPWQTRVASFRLPNCGGVDSTPPSVSSFAPTTASPTNATTVSYALAFSESVTGLAAGDFTLGGTATGCSVGAPSGSGSSYTVGLTGCSEGTVSLTLKADSVADLATNPGPTTSATAATVTIDRTAPTASLSCSTASPTNGTSISCSVTFSETVAGGSSFGAGDVSRTGTSTTWTVGTPSGSGPYAFTVSQTTPRADGTVILQVVAGAIKDAAGNSSVASSTVTTTIDQTAPATALGGSPAPGTTAATSISVTATFSESVTGFAAGDVSLGGTSNAATPWSVGTVSGGPTIYTFTVSAADPADGGLTIAVPSGGATDAAGNGNATSNTLSYVIDRASPGATLTPPASPTNATTLGYGVTFTEPVTGLTASDFALTGTATGCLVGAPSGSAASYTVGVSGCSAGTVILTLKANAVTDGTGNPGPPSDVAASSVLIDRTAPTTTTPLTGLRTNVTYSSSLAAVVTWTGSDTGGAGIATYDVERSIDGAAFTVIATGLSSPALNVSIASSHTYRFAVRARDHAGNVGPWRGGSTTSKIVRQDTSSSLTYAGTWHTATSSSYSGGSVHYSTAAGASVRYTFTGRSIAVVTTQASSRGQVKVYLDGVFQGTVDTFAASTAYRRVVWSKTFAVAGSHTIKLVVVGTAGRPRVDLDAFLVLK
jgi:Big-like domain-containing protein